MYPYTSQYPQTYPQAATYIGPRSAPGSAVFTLVCSIVVFALVLLLSPLTIIFSIAAAYTKGLIALPVWRQASAKAA